MAKTAHDAPARDLREFFSAAEARTDRWRTLHRVARALAGGGPAPSDALRGEAQAALAELDPLESLCGYPGPRLMSQAHERLETGDWTGFARLVQRISSALLSSTYRDEQEACWHCASSASSASRRSSPST